jgi:hypothetical protein
MSAKDKGKGKTYQWLVSHKNEPDEGHCLIWPFFRDKCGRGWLKYLGKSHYAHRLMCKLVKGEPPTQEHHAAHTCGKGHLGCVHPKHLEWKTPSENMADCVVHGTQPKHHLGNKGHFTREQVDQIRELLKSNTQRAVAGMYGVTESTISNIARGLYYARPSKVNHWSPEEDEKLRSGVHGGLSFPEIAAKIGRSVFAVSNHAYKIGLRSGRASTVRQGDDHG